MMAIFLINYGEVFGDTTYCNDEISDQLIIYNNHMKYPATKLAYHAWDEDGSSAWADPITHCTSEVWCRGLGDKVRNFSPEGERRLEQSSCVPVDRNLLYKTP